MGNEVAVRFSNVTKIYKLYKNSRQRFKGLFSKKGFSNLYKPFCFGSGVVASQNFGES